MSVVIFYVQVSAASCMLSKILDNVGAGTLTPISHKTEKRNQHNPLPYSEYFTHNFYTVKIKLENQF